MDDGCMDPLHDTLYVSHVDVDVEAYFDLN
jgi:hypothetical protein